MYKKKVKGGGGQKMWPICSKNLLSQMKFHVN